MRVVSLVPSVTESLLTWGITPVAVTRFCEQPGFDTVGGTKDPDVGKIVALRPDLVVVNDEENRIEDHDALVDSGVMVHVVRIRTLEDVAPAMRDLRGRLGLPAIADDALPPRQSPRVRAFVPIWRRPWMSINADTYGSSILDRIGVSNVCAAATVRFPEVDPEDVVADVVVAPSEPYPFAERHRAELERVAPVVFVDGRDLFWWGARTSGAIGRLRAAIS